MKVIVGKMPGGRAKQIEVTEGTTVLDAINTAGYGDDLNSGYEARLNNQTVGLNTVISPNSIISLVQKITGNSLAPIKFVPIFKVLDHYNEIESSMILTDVPMYLNDFLQYEDVRKEIRDNYDEVDNNVLFAAVLTQTELSAPQSIILGENGEITSFSNGIEIHKDDIVCVFSAETMTEIYSLNSSDAADYVYSLIEEDKEDSSSEECGDEECACEECACEECACEECDCDNNITIKDIADLCRENNMVIHMSYFSSRSDDDCETGNCQCRKNLTIKDISDLCKKNDIMINAEFRRD